MTLIKRTTVFMFLLCVCLVGFICNKIYDKLQKYHLKHRQYQLDEALENSENMEVDTMLHQFQKSYLAQEELVDTNKIIKYINEKQHIYNIKKFGSASLKFENAVIVVKVHDNIRYLAVLLDSMRQMKYITKSLLIFAHDVYDKDINSLLKQLSFTRIMQIFYPYSTAMHPNIYPGNDARFCREVTQCISSNKRNATLAQTKLFWWWVVKYVFNHVEILKSYDGFIYFMDTEHYLTNDFIHMAKMLERLQRPLCKDCRIISLAASAPRPELYEARVHNVLVTPWGWSNYSNSVIGFNRRTWYEMRTYKRDFCYFNDYSWERSLRYLASKTEQKSYVMLAPEGARAFPTTGCGAFRKASNCTLKTNLLDVVEFNKKIRKRLGPENFKLRAVNVDTRVDAGRGGWEDARDREFCMFFGSSSSRVYQ